MSLKKPLLSPASAAAASRRAARRREAEAVNAENGRGEEAVGNGRRAPVEKPFQPRQRLKNETRAQMLDRLTNPQISLYEASVILKVCTATVRRYSDTGELAHTRTEGGQRRFYLRDVLTLLRQREARQNAARRERSA